jgi:hypothetical protein
MRTKPATGKASVKIVKNAETGRTRKVSYGQKGANVDPGSKRADSYCARSAGIKGDWKSDPNSPNNLSRRKWKCIGRKSAK